jgi:hypothetical protein
MNELNYLETKIVISILKSQRFAKSGRSVKLTTYIHLVPRLRMRGAAVVLAVYVEARLDSWKIICRLLPLRSRPCCRHALHASCHEQNCLQYFGV